jgi:hypothetical protein
MTNAFDDDDANDGKPPLTGNTHIFMERDLLAERYYLEQNGEHIHLADTHFQPIFFARKVDDLREDPDANKALKKFRIFVGPDEFVEELKTF